jgi:hypothetical protein
MKIKKVYPRTRFGKSERGWKALLIRWLCFASFLITCYFLNVRVILNNALLLILHHYK